MELTKTKRFTALDIFRGMTICLMIIVNTPGDYNATFSLLLHANWHGFTPTDLVFPSFLFAIGSSLVFVKSKWKDKEASQVFFKIIKRSVIIFLLGYLMYWFPFFDWTDSGSLTFRPISETRILGVLQRIALCYLAASVMIYYFTPRQLVISSVAILLGYWFVMGVFGDYTLPGNAALMVDKIILGASHLYTGDGIPFDPEGLLSTFPSIVNILGGYLLGLFLTKTDLSSYRSLALPLLAGISLLFVGFLWDFLFPINKKLWTSSFVIFTIGLDLIVFSFILYLTDFIKKPWKFKFFETFGVNPLFIYLLSEYLAILMWWIPVGDISLFDFLYQKGFSFMGPYVGSLAFALAFMMINWSMAKWLENRKIIIKV
ncbi:MAG: DUF5009 domain-containing protein [Cyclobacteriaceae bacterium]|nr:DUF5009 domain-containing protein [Cyclobacteriaceae bacterium]